MTQHTLSTLVRLLLISSSVLMTSLALANEAMPQGNAAAGEKKIETCVACHGQDGNSVISSNPNLAGQHSEYLMKVLQDYKEGKRSNPIMAGMVANLSEQDMADLAAYFSSQAENTGETDPALLEKGQMLYRAGDAKRGIPACIGCHGPAGQGNGLAQFPKLGGQNPDYVIASLKAYQIGQRGEGPMEDIAFKMNDTDMQAVASYIYGLYPTGKKLPEEAETPTAAAK